VKSSAGGVLSSSTIAESDVTNLTTDLAAKAPTASPTFTGTVNAAGIISSTSITGTTPVNGGSSGGLVIRAPASGTQTSSYLQFVNNANSAQWGSIEATTASIMNYSGTAHNFNAAITSASNVFANLGTYDQFRALSTNYGAMIRNDDSNTYILITASGDKLGSWNALRPFYINNSTGLVKMDNGFQGNNRAYVTDQPVGFTITAAMAGSTQRTTSATAMTITLTNVLSIGDRIDFIQYGAGQITFAASGVTLNSSGGKLKTTGIYSGTTVQCVASGVYVLIGDIAA
jgi:hypothetical protein